MVVEGEAGDEGQLRGGARLGQGPHPRLRLRRHLHLAHRRLLRPAAFDSLEIAYCKSKDAAERYELLKIAVCPFTVQGSKLFAHP